MFCVRSCLSLFLCQEKRDGLRDAAFLFRVGRDRREYVLMALYGYRTSLVHFGLVRFLVAIPTEYGVGGAM